jgi:hypothetical protein
MRYKMKIWGKRKGRKVEDKNRIQMLSLSFGSVVP